MCVCTWMSESEGERWNSERRGEADKIRVVTGNHEISYRNPLTCNFVETAPPTKLIQLFFSLFVALVVNNKCQSILEISSTF